MENENPLPPNYITNNYIVNQTANLLDNAKTFFIEVDKGNTEYLNNKYYEIERYLLKVIVEVETKYIDRLTFDRIDFLFGKLVGVKQQLKKHLNTESYNEFKEFYGEVDYDLDLDKPKQVIEPNPFREEYLKRLNGHLNIITRNSDIESTTITKQEPKTYINETWFIVSLALATGRVDELKTKNKSWVYIEKKILEDQDNNLFFGKDIKPRSFSNWISKSWLNDKTKNEITDPENYRKNIFVRDEVDEEMDLVIAYCIEHNIEIQHDNFKEREKIYRLENGLF
ncbi:hypothetical protein [Altibacter sp.]|uniref:hypothetical protein n=1 Tax=Altibacter sp. TaxID=2024823 RepID=UPI0025B94F86|nr:hypothetical protein [Altibacter sp.]